MSASDDIHSSEPTARVLIAHNLLDRIDSASFGGQGRALQMIYGGGTGKTVKFSHSTITSAQNAFFTFGDSAPVLEQLWFTDSIVAHGDYGAFGSGQGEGTAALDHFFTSYVFSNNVIFGGGSASQYPASNSVAASSDQVGFVDAAGGNYALDDSSPYKGSASNGGDPGADMAAVQQATATVISAN